MLCSILINMKAWDAYLIGANRFAEVGRVLQQLCDSPYHEVAFEVVAIELGFRVLQLPRLRTHGDTVDEVNLSLCKLFEPATELPALITELHEKVSH